MMSEEATIKQQHGDTPAHWPYRVCSIPPKQAVVTMTTLRQTNPARCDGMVWALSPHYIMLIRPQQALLLARIYCKLFVFKYIF